MGLRVPGAPLGLPLGMEGKAPSLPGEGLHLAVEVLGVGEGRGRQRGPGNGRWARRLNAPTKQPQVRGPAPRSLAPEGACLCGRGPWRPAAAVRRGGRAHARGSARRWSRGTEWRRGLKREKREGACRHMDRAPPQHRQRETPFSTPATQRDRPAAQPDTLRQRLSQQDPVARPTSLTACVTSTVGGRRVLVWRPSPQRPAGSIQRPPKRQNSDS